MSTITDGVTFTEAAIVKIHDLLKQEEDHASLLRVKVIGGGCSGFQYVFDIENDEGDAEDDADIEDDDDDFFDDSDDDEDYIVKDTNNVAIAVIDNNSLKYLKNCTIDYIDDLTESSFVVQNPQAKARCGCGNSFTV